MFYGVQVWVLTGPLTSMLSQLYASGHCHDEVWTSGRMHALWNRFSSRTYPFLATFIIRSFLKSPSVSWSKPFFLRADCWSAAEVVAPLTSLQGTLEALLEWCRDLSHLANQGSSWQVKLGEVLMVPLLPFDNNRRLYYQKHSDVGLYSSPVLCFPLMILLWRLRESFGVGFLSWHVVWIVRSIHFARWKTQANRMQLTKKLECHSKQSKCICKWESSSFNF